MTQEGGLSPRDPNSYSRPELAVVTHLSLDLSIDFTKKILHGNVKLDILKNEEKVDEVILDTKDLKISKVLDPATKTQLKYQLGENNGEFGSKLTIKLPDNKSNKCLVMVAYETSPKASGLQWLTAQQTSGKEAPYLFSQFQAIHARSVIPCQDTPAVKTKYHATITAPADLTVLMSAVPESTETIGASKRSKFSQEVPVPSYLIALAAGALESRRIGPRSHVWAEKEIVEAAAHEFADTEYQLCTAEAICGPYVWGIYDLLVLPPSFAYGGMENPCLTFVTPTLLAGDKSLANVVAHEIAHSWTGNLITNRNFEHFWLNEGFTVFMERKIKGRLTSVFQQDFDAQSGLTELEETIARLGNTNPFTKLVLDLKGVNPDDSFSVVPYEKGHIFLRYLEELVGGPNTFEPFLKEYFETYKFKSIDTDDFKSLFLSYFKDKDEIHSIDWETWLFAPGMPPKIPTYDNTFLEACEASVDRFFGEDLPSGSDDVRNLSVEQIIYVLQQILQKTPLTVEQLHKLDHLFNCSEVQNAEIKFKWLRIGLKSRWTDSVEPTIKWINEVGRMKYVRPLYRDLYDWVEVRQRAIDNFKEHRKNMMYVVAYTVSKDLHLES